MNLLNLLNFGAYNINEISSEVIENFLKLVAECGNYLLSIYHLVICNKSYSTSCLQIKKPGKCKGKSINTRIHENYFEIYSASYKKEIYAEFLYWCSQGYVLGPIFEGQNIFPIKESTEIFCHFWKVCINLI